MQRTVCAIFVFEFDVCNHRGQRAWLQLWTVNSLPMTLCDRKLINIKRHIFNNMRVVTPEKKRTWTRVWTKELIQESKEQLAKERDELIRIAASYRLPEDCADCSRSWRAWSQCNILGVCPICYGEGVIGSLCWNGTCNHFDVEYCFYVRGGRHETVHERLMKSK